MIEQAYFKEYLTYQFKYGKHLADAHLRHVHFADSCNADPDSLPAALLDLLAAREELYVLDWQREEGAWVLAVKSLASEKWTHIRMGVLPETVALSGGMLYLQAGRELALL